MRSGYRSRRRRAPRLPLVLTREQFDQIVDQRMSEAELQEWLRLRCLELGWPLYYHTWSSRHSPKGFPDTLIGRLVPRPRLVVAELKSELGMPTVEQLGWLALFRALAALCPAIEVYLWRPRDRRAIQEVLSR